MKPKLLAMMLLAGGLCCRQSAITAGPSAEWVDGPVVGQLDLLGVAFVDEDTGWAVGDIASTGEGGVIYQTTDGGASWRPLSRTAEILTSIWFINAKTGWAAGDAGRIQRTDDGGLTWQTQRGEREGEVLNSIFFLDEHQGVAAGGSGLILRTSNGGALWEPILTGRVEDLWIVRFATRQNGWATGEDGLILATKDGGRTWVQQPSGTNHALMGLAIAPSGTVIAVGAVGTILRTEDGEHWTTVESGTVETLNAVAAATTNVFWAVGSRKSFIGSTDAGRSWTNVGDGQTGKIASDFTSIELRGPARGVAVGERGATRILQRK